MADFTAMILEQGFAMSPLFDLPLFTFKNICIDILHACDLGVTQDIVGNILFLALGIASPSNAEINPQQKKFHQKAYRKSGMWNTILS